MRMGQCPAPYGAADGYPALDGVLAPGPVEGLLRVLTEGVVRVDDEGGQQVVPAGEVAVERRGDHAELTGDGPQGQSRGAFGQELAARLLLDGGGHFDSGPCPGSSDDAQGASVPSIGATTNNENTALAFVVSRCNA